MNIAIMLINTFYLIMIEIDHLINLSLFLSLSLFFQFFDLLFLKLN